MEHDTRTPGDSRPMRGRQPDAQTMIDPNEMFDVLSDRCRRMVLSRLLDGDGPTALDGLLAEITSERGESSAALTLPNAQLATSLHHVHLPKLTAAGFVKYDPEAETIAATERAGLVEPFLETTGEGT